MAKSLRDWVGPFVVSELQAVLAWRDAIRQVPKVKKDPDARFSDDNSNFRSIVGSPPLTADSKVQVLRVMSVTDPAIVLLSDGVTAIKARLSKNAVESLEADLDDKLSEDMRGDVISLHAVTVVSTPYGPPDGYVQLDVNELQYHYTWRKSIGSLQSIEQHEGVRHLLERVREIRSQQFADRDGIENSNIAFASDSPPRNPPDVVSKASQGEEDGVPPSPPATRSQPSSPTLNTATSSNQSAFATQAPMSRRKVGPSSTKEGFEHETGVNLAPPVGPMSTATNPPGLPPDRGAKLLGLLGRAKEPSPVPAAQPEPAILEQTELGSTQDHPSQPLAALATQIVADNAGQQHQSRNKRPATPAQVDSHRKLLYKRRRIPKAQRRLLENESSWFPSSPGRQFPRPNIPVELLSFWNSHIPQDTTDSSPRSQTRPQTPSQAQEKQEWSKDGSLESNSDDSTDASDISSSNDELPWSQSPSQQKREWLPPDSSVDGRSTDSERFKSPSEPATSPQNRNLGSQSSIVRATIREPTPTSSPSVDWPRGDTKGRNSPPHKSRPPRSPLHTPLKPAAHSPDSMSRSVENTPSTVGAQPLPYRSPLKHALPPKPPPSVHLDTVIKGTQFSGNGDEIEIGVPRSLRDPHEVHRQRRSKHLRAAQRANWLKENHVVDHHHPAPHIGKVHDAYRTAFPGDNVSSSEFGDILKRVFPVLREQPPKSLTHASNTRNSSPASVRGAGETIINSTDGAKLQASPAPAKKVRSGPPAAQSVNCRDETSGQTSPVEVKKERSKHTPGRTGAVDNSAFGANEDRDASRPDPQGASRARPAQRLPVTQAHRAPTPAQRPQPCQGPVTARRAISSAPHGPEPPVKTDTAPRPGHGEDDTQNTNEKLPRSIPVFEEFAKAWKNNRPGGAFARDRPSVQRGPPRVNVLSWKV